LQCDHQMTASGRTHFEDNLATSVPLYGSSHTKNHCPRREPWLETRHGLKMGYYPASEDEAVRLRGLLTLLAGIGHRSLRRARNGARNHHAWRGCAPVTVSNSMPSVALVAQSKGIETIQGNAL